MSIKRIPPRITKTSAAPMKLNKEGSHTRFGSENRNGGENKALLSGQAKTTTPKK